MSELLDVFDDVGLLDRETREFLVEALENSEAADWRDILEPFISPPDPALDALAKVPGVIERSKKALAKAVLIKEEEVSPIADAFLKALPSGILGSSGLHTVVRIARACRLAHDTVAQSDLWRQRTERAATLWFGRTLGAEGGKASASTAPKPPAAWREKYFTLLRPRLDGVYIGECGFRRWLRLGHHMDLRKNAEALAFKGTRGGGGEWVSYRRYIRLLPPDEADGSLWALVLQDPCPREVAEQVLAVGVDVLSHANPAKSEGSLPDTAPAGASDHHRLRKRICAGKYKVSPDGGRIDIRYTATDGEYRLTMSLAHGPRNGFANVVTWENYDMAEDGGAGEVINFNLGRLPEWKGGGLEDENKDHFPQMRFRPLVALEQCCA